MAVCGKMLLFFVFLREFDTVGLYGSAVGYSIVSVACIIFGGIASFTVIEFPVSFELRTLRVNVVHVLI